MDVRPPGALILIVDEDERDAALVVGALEEAGYETRVCSSGEEALGLVRLLRPDVAVLGVRLPGTSGYEVCYQLRAEVGQAIRVLLLSGKRTDPLDLTVGLLLGADDYMTKPVAMGELVARTTRLLRTAAPHTGSEDDTFLTSREREVLALLADGLPRKEIARSLGLKPKAVRSDLKQIVAKLDAASRADAVSRAYDLGVLSRRRDAAEGRAEAALPDESRARRPARRGAKSPADSPDRPTENVGGDWAAAPPPHDAPTSREPG